MNKRKSLTTEDTEEIRGQLHQLFACSLQALGSLACVDSFHSRTLCLRLMDFSSIRLITFDCYGTLIDWETGMLRGLRPMFARNGHDVSDGELLAQYGEVEAEIEGS